MNGDENLRLMFLASKKFESGKSIRGAFLLTDITTKPVEFRCTNAIRPTTLQTVLYGDILEQHILVELIGVPLINSIRERPHIVLVNEPGFLATRSRVDVPFIQVAKEESIPVSSAEDEDERQLVHSSSGRFEPILLIPHSKFQSDRDQAKALLTDVFEGHDLLEPFNRISTALEQVHQQKIGEAS